MKSHRLCILFANCNGCLGIISAAYLSTLACFSIFFYNQLLTYAKCSTKILSELSNTFVIGKMRGTSLGLCVEVLLTVNMIINIFFRFRMVLQHIMALFFPRDFVLLYNKQILCSAFCFS